LIGTSEKGWVSAAIAALTAILFLPATAQAFDPVLEARNFAKIGERFTHIVATPEFQARLQQANVENNAETALIQATDPERVFVNICGTRTNECAGDVRFYDWNSDGAGIRTPVLFTGRSGATLSGNVWATEAGPEKRPAVVITTGSVQAPETLYWGQAATLAKHGYVVLTYDVQGQSRSDVLGEAPDTQEGVPSQAGQPFYDGTEDALDFLLSKPANPYEPRLSCGNANGGVGTSHAPKEERRVEAGLNAGFNPLHGLVDKSRIGIAGHSLGAAAVSYVGQIDQRVDAIVAWDNLRPPGDGGAFDAPDCPSTPESRPDTITVAKPAIGISNDYGITQQPYTEDPDPQSNNAGFQAYEAAGVDSMQVNIRGGTHEESAFIPGNTTGPAPLGAASLRGSDVVAWYSTAWFDRYVKCPGTSDEEKCARQAEKRLLSDRWQADAPGEAVDLNDDGNLFSFYLRSRFDFTATNGDELICDDMRAGCESMGPDGGPVPYSFVGDAYDVRGGGSGESCALPQQGTDGRDTPKTLPPTESGDALRGGKGADRLRGGGGDDCLYGQRGRDRLRGNAGDDRLSGGGGRDHLVGGPGADTLKCGQGRKDVAEADAGDTVAASCERVRGV
jgi:dienelactone hydrolase